MTEREDHPLYLEGIACFNRGSYLESHEVWETLWKETTGPARDFLKGLIQAAVCLHHLGNGNGNGAAKLWETSRGYLLRYQPVFWGLDVVALVQAVACRHAAVREARDSPPSCEGPFIRLTGSTTV